MKIIKTGIPKSGQLKSILLSFIFLLVLGYQASAQAVQNAVNLNYIPPSPSAAALGKFGEIPVSLSTGIPTVDLPLFSYKGISNGLALNVSLDYHAGGVRVEEIASNIGIGWALNSGGVINRTSRGLPDDMQTYGFVANYPLPAPAYTPGQPPATNMAQRYVDNSLDGEQDEFSFNFNGHSGRFMLDGHGDPVLITKSALKITPIKGAGTTGLPYKGFIITDESGIKYIFQDQELTTVKLSSIISIVTYASSYYISSIINPTSRDTINFTYTTAGNKINNIGSESASNSYVNSFSTTLSTSTVYDVSQGTSTTVVTKKIKTIQFPDNTEIDFLYRPLSRCDLMGDSTLAEVRQKNTLTGQYKGFKLFQSYSTTTGTVAYSPAPCNLADNKNKTDLRLRLDSVQQTGGASAANPYKFVYNDTYHLPATDSRKQDFWGYYNGSVNNTGHLVPQMLYYDASTHSSYMLSGADRRVDSNAVSAGALTKFIYPTGGYTQFEYESNRISPDQVITTHSENNFVVFDADETPTRAFTINNQPDNQTLDYNFRLISWCPGTPVTCTFTFKIKSADGTISYATQTFSHSEIGTTKTSHLTLPNGNYQLTWALNSPTNCSCNENFGFNLSYLSSVRDTVSTGGLGAGIRIKRTVVFDGISHNNDMIKQYAYTDDLGKSTGYAAAQPQFDHDYADCARFETPTPGGATLVETRIQRYLVRTATTNYPLTYSNGGINYARVTVTDTGPVYNGKTVSYFTSYKEYPPMISAETLALKFPFAPLQILDWNIGLLTREDIYNATGQILKRTINSYSLGAGELDTIANYKVGITRLNSCGASPFDYPGVTNGASAQTAYQSLTYFKYLNRVDKLQSTTVDYTASGDSLVNNVYYAYDPNYYTLSKEMTVGSKGDTVASYHYYPFDYNISGSVFAAMRDSNMIARPVSNETWKYLSNKYYLVGADATSYKLYGGAYLPGQYFSLKSTNPVDPATIGPFNASALLRVPSLYDQKINFSSYDSNANSTLINQHGMRTAYIWDMNKQYPIAKVSNADSLSVAYTSFEADGTGNWTIASALRDTSTAITGKRSYKLVNGSISFAGLATAKNYVVSYWSRNGAYTLTNGGTLKTGVSLNGWTYYEHAITGTGTLSISGSGNIDELRLYPVTAQMMTYTYDPLSGITSTADAKNDINYYEYDGLQRLKNIKDQYGNILKNFYYNYAGQAGSPIVPTYFNTVQTGTFYRNNCSASYVGSAVVYTVPAETYSSTVSQAAADNLAIADVNAHGQDNANAQGTCTLCTGNAYKIINHNCEQGNKVYTSSVPQSGHYLCTYHYEWSDGSKSSNYTETSPTACAI